VTGRGVTSSAYGGWIGCGRRSARLRWRGRGLRRSYRARSRLAIFL